MAEATILAIKIVRGSGALKKAMALTFPNEREQEARSYIGYLFFRAKL